MKRTSSTRGHSLLGRAMLASGIVMILVGSLGSMALATHAPSEPDSDCDTRPSGVPLDYACALLDEQGGGAGGDLEGEVWWTRDSNNDFVFDVYTRNQIEDDDDTVKACVRSSGSYSAPDKCLGNDPGKVYEGDPSNPEGATYDHDDTRLLLTIDLDADPPDIDPGDPAFWQLHINQFDEEESFSTFAQGGASTAGTTTTTEATTTTTGDPGETTTTIEEETTTTEEALVLGGQFERGDALANTGLTNLLSGISLAGHCLTLGGILLTFGQRQSARRREEAERANPTF